MMQTQTKVSVILPKSFAVICKESNMEKEMGRKNGIMTAERQKDVSVKETSL